MIQLAIRIMEAVNILLMVMFGLLGLIALFLGGQIKQNESLEIISLPNLSPEKIRDKAGFCHFAGNRLLIFGFSSIVTAVIVALLPQFMIWAILLFILLIAALSLELAMGYKKYL